MAAGDLIVGTSAANTAITFTPAAGVEIIIKSASLNPGTSALRYTGASGGQIISSVAGANIVYNPNAPCTNSLAIYIDAAGAGLTNSYGGIQTK